MTDVNEDRPAGGIEPSRDAVVVRRSGQGWQVGNEEASDLTSAMVLADLFAAEAGSRHRHRLARRARRRRARKMRRRGWP